MRKRVSANPARRRPSALRARRARLTRPSFNAPNHRLTASLAPAVIPPVPKVTVLPTTTSYVAPQTATPEPAQEAGGLAKKPAAPKVIGSRSAFPDCCGIEIIHNLGGDYGGEGNSDEAIKASLDYYVGGDIGMYLIALNHFQVEKYDKVLKEKKFFPVVKEAVHNGWEGNKITLYAYVCEPAATSKEGIPIEITACADRETKRTSA